MTIINIRGTSGAGKSFIAYRLMDQFKTRADLKQTFAGRERIVGVRLSAPKRRDLVLAGRYTTACGGCDCLSWKGAADDIMGLVKKWNADADVLLEGLMVSSWAAPRLLTLCNDYGATLIQLTTPLEDCLDAVQSRRDKRAADAGKEALPLNPKNTASKWRSVYTQGVTLKALGARIEFLDRAAAYRRCCELLSLKKKEM
jgi:hypothetical protein